MFQFHANKSILWVGLVLLAAGTPLCARAQNVYYSKSGTSIPYCSTWNGSSWGAATALPTLSSNGYWFQAAKHPSSGEVACAATDVFSTIKIMFNTTGTFATPSTLVNLSGLTTVRKFAIAYEQSSGDCMVAYSTGFAKSAAYRTATGGTLSGAATAITSTALAMDCIRLVAKPDADELMILAVDYNDDLRARIWSGTAWGTTTTLSSSVQSAFEESFAALYESTSGDGLIVYSNASSTTPNYRTYTSGAWSSQMNMPACSSTPQYIHLAANPDSDEVVCGIIDGAAHVRIYVWNGSSWASNLEIGTNVGYTDRRPFDMAYAPDGSKALVVYSDNTNSPVYRTSSGGSWSSAVSMADMGHKAHWVQVVPGASGGEMFVAIADAGLDLNVWRWDGTAMGAMTTIDSSLGGSVTTEQFWLLGPAPGSAVKRIVNWHERRN